MPPLSTALVTGAAGGIGEAIVRRLAADGLRIVLHANRSAAAAETICASLPGGPHHVVSADLTDPVALERLVAESKKLLGRIDVLVNNAGVAERHSPLEVSYDQWREAWERIVSVNLIAASNLSYLVAREMVGQSGGRIISVSSRGAFRGEPEMPAYGASKAGLNAMTQSLAKALAPSGVYCYVVAPGWVSTEMSAPRRALAAEAITRDYPMGRVTTPEEVANAIAFLATGEAASMTGAILDINGASYLRS